MLSKNELKYIRSLTVGKFRKKLNCFIAEGSTVIDEFIKEQWNIEIIYSINSDYFKTFNGEVRAVSSKELSQISAQKSPQDALAIIRMPEKKTIGKNLNSQFILGCDRVQDPGNMGTIVRIADWFGIEHVFCSKECADIYNPKVVQASMGSIARVNVTYCDLEELISSQENLSVIGADLAGNELYKSEMPQSGMILVGNESKGISPELLKVCAHRVKIPGKGNAESLNVAVATGILCAELIYGRANLRK